MWEQIASAAAGFFGGGSTPGAAGAPISAPFIIGPKNVGRGSATMSTATDGGVSTIPAPAAALGGNSTVWVVLAVVAGLAALVLFIPSRKRP